MKTLELHYTMIQLLININYTVLKINMRRKLTDKSEQTGIILGQEYQSLRPHVYKHSV